MLTIFCLALKRKRSERDWNVQITQAEQMPLAFKSRLPQRIHIFFGHEVPSLLVPHLFNPVAEIIGSTTVPSVFIFLLLLLFRSGRSIVNDPLGGALHLRPRARTLALEGGFSREHESSALPAIKSCLDSSISSD